MGWPVGCVLTVCCLALALAATAQEPPEPAPKAPWPQSTATTPSVNAADFGLKPAASDKMAVEVFGENPDCSDALQAACDAGAGGLVYIPAGAYRVTRSIRIQSGTTVMGAGHCSTMLLSEQALPAILHLRVSGPMTTIRDLWVAGPVGGNWNATGIWLDGSNGVTVRDCWVSALGTGIRVDGISDTWLRNIVFELNQHGIRVECPELSWASGNLRLLDCYGYQNYGAGITLTNCRGVQMQACSSVGSAFLLDARNCAQVTITGSNVNWDRSPWRQFGIRLEGCEHVTLGENVIEGMKEFGLSLIGCKRASVTANIVRNTTEGPGIVFRDCQGLAASANVVSESYGDGISATACKMLALTGNVVDTYGMNAPERTSAAGIRVDAACEPRSLAGNLVAPEEGGGPAVVED